MPVTANAIASRLVENGRYKKPDRQYSISVRKAVHQLTANTHSDVNLCEEVSNTETTQAIHNMKCGKSPGLDNIHPEFVKNLGPFGFKWLAAFFSTCMRLNLLRKIWRKANIIAILKPGKDAKVPKSYRTISLLCVPFKILEPVILCRILAGQALADAGPNARPRHGAHLSSDFMTSSCSVNRVTIVVERIPTVKH